MSPSRHSRLIRALRDRFAANPSRHRNMTWEHVEARLLAHPDRLDALDEMERSGGEPDVVDREEAGAVVFVDCSAESPAGRRSLCYDHEALDARKQNKPGGAAAERAAAMGVALLTEAQYRALQELGEFDRKTSSWIFTPAAIRSKGGALFCDLRYGMVFVYHNGAESYYAARGFRGRLAV